MTPIIFVFLNKKKSNKPAYKKFKKIIIVLKFYI